MFTTATYNIESNKLKGNLKVALVSDLHSCKHGDNQCELIDAIATQKPDIVLLCGDIFDHKICHKNAKIFLRNIAKQYPCFYVSGNHEYWNNEINEIKMWLKNCGLTVLEGNCDQLQIRGQKINICGVDDPDDKGIEKTKAQIAHTNQLADLSYYTILMTHRPELVETYQKYQFDLVVAGHAHGGQWRIPKILNGLYAPGQGLFPKYAGGYYRLNDKTNMIVSRGLAKETTRVPRIFNPPELVIINISK